LNARGEIYLAAAKKYSGKEDRYDENSHSHGSAEKERPPLPPSIESIDREVFSVSAFSFFATLRMGQVTNQC
jgi:hypothetical protein